MAGVRLSHRLRLQFIDYFVKEHGHEHIRYSSVIPEKDRSIEFVNAGMNQFKHLFLHEEAERPSLKRACNYQKCIRVGGKLCDLQTVGRDFRHHTFFEMLGNWSFDDYGKEEACRWAWQYLTDHLKLNKERLFITYFGGSTKDETDTETRDIWSRLGLDAERIIENRQGDNFWEMGSHGPCGKSTEIFYLLEPCGRNLTHQNINTSLEIWNIVFVNQRRLENGNLIDLKRNFIDTGMGLERITSVAQNVNSNYDTDLFEPLFDILQQKTNCEPYHSSVKNKLDINYRIIADHARMITMSLADGLEPGRRGAANDLRKIIKRSFWIAENVFESSRAKYLLFDLVDGVVETLKDAYPELESRVPHIRRTLQREYVRFTSNNQIIQDRFLSLVDAEPKHSRIFDSKLAYLLYKENGASVEQIDSLCKKYNKLVDWDSFRECKPSSL